MLRTWQLAPAVSATNIANTTPDEGSVAGVCRALRLPDVDGPLIVWSEIERLPLLGAGFLDTGVDEAADVLADLGNEDAPVVGERPPQQEQTGAVAGPGYGTPAGDLVGAAPIRSHCPQTGCPTGESRPVLR